MVDVLEEILLKDYGCEYPQGAVIFSEGDPGQLVYLIRSGRVQIAKSVGGRIKVLAVLEKGDFFGEMSLISERPRSATATALEDCRFLAMNSDMFFKLLRTDYDMTVHIIEQLAGRLAEADRRLEILLFADATGRLVKLLEGAGGDVLPLSLEQAAYELGVPLERLQRIAAKLQEKGIMRVEPEALTIVSRERLAKLKHYLTLKDEFGQID